MRNDYNKFFQFRKYRCHIHEYSRILTAAGTKVTEDECFRARNEDSSRLPDHEVEKSLTPRVSMADKPTTPEADRQGMPLMESLSERRYLYYILPEQNGTFLGICYPLMLVFNCFNNFRYKL